MYTIARFSIGLAFLLIAAGLDIKTRRVPDELWMVMSILAIVVLIVQLVLTEAPLLYMLIFVPIVFFLVEAFVDRPVLYDGSRWNPLVLLWFLVPIITMAYLVGTFHGDPEVWPLLAIPAMMLVAFVLYYLYVLHGGADAKAVLALAVLLPYYPYIEGITNYGVDRQMVEAMQSLFPFTFVILLNSSLIALVLPVFYLILNTKRGDFNFPQMLLGFKTEAASAKNSFVWSMEYMEDGERKLRLRPKEEDESIYDDFPGDEKIWVTPKIPFIVLMCIGFVLSFIIGNPLLHLL